MSTHQHGEEKGLDLGVGEDLLVQQDVRLGQGHLPQVVVLLRDSLGFFHKKNKKINKINHPAYFGVYVYFVPSLSMRCEYANIRVMAWKKKNLI